MKFALKSSLLGLSLVTAFASNLLAPIAYAEDKHAVHWDYQGEGKPENWDKLKEEYATCKLSKEQSPINIETKAVAKAALPALAFGYTPTAAEIVNNGHTIQINLANAGSLKIAADEYKFLQFHFHTPSEEQIDGKNYPLVAHFVHKSEAGKLAVVAVLFKVGKKNETLAPVFAALPAKEGASNKLANIDAKAILPTGQKYYAFMGSLTTPPCSDGVRWQVLKDPVEVSAEQLASFTKLYKMNARPVQPLNGRKVQVSE
ncbi:MAG: carbonic anhydrase family protein [Burkholderiales bacterium]|nr:carbonic anhydrase family protein [Burkholderiales bacterium]